MVSTPLAFNAQAPQTLDMLPQTAPSAEKAGLRVVTQNRLALGLISAKLPDGEMLRMSSLRQFSGTQALYKPGEDKKQLTNVQTGTIYRPNMDTGFYQAVNAQGEWQAGKLSPGFTVGIGWGNFLRVLHDEGIQKPFLSIFVWTVVFALLTVALTVAVGMVLACVVQWEELRGKAAYRIPLILPYAVPAFISILIFKGLFNQSFGEINLMLSALFGIKPAWFSDPWTAKSMIIIVNTWPGYPYMMILCMGLLKAIPDDLYEASGMDGATPMQNFFRITLPLLIKTADAADDRRSAFNLNNSALIQTADQRRAGHARHHYTSGSYRSAGQPHLSHRL
ncbi:maltose ABC transporter permease MalF [Rahnella perminowiae]|uniref:maltose ABC transporter permease MalF n=1 Tax=Rahnella perminowiae TaxID=2816244 RepID=UPI003B8A8E96